MGRLARTYRLPGCGGNEEKWHRLVHPGTSLGRVGGCAEVEIRGNQLGGSRY